MSYSKRQVGAARHKRQIEEEAKRVRELVADLPFHKVILQEYGRGNCEKFDLNGILRRMRSVPTGGDMHFRRQWAGPE